MRILRGLRSQLLPCGCLAGTYETYDGRIVYVLDEHEADCPDLTHAVGNSIPEPPLFDGGSDARVHPPRPREP